MCGFAGFWRSGGWPEAAAVLQRMGATLNHRGPDDGGRWYDADAGLGLAHRRLAIVDLSAAGHQPMMSASGRYVIAFNGEIYNHRALRAELQRAAVFCWHGHSDTETLLAAIEHWDLPGALQRCNGMFALALWDRQTRTLHLARDRLGEKPLYYGHSGGVLLFGSELKALRAHPAWQVDIDRSALALLLRHNYIPAPHSIYQGIHKLPPGSYLSVTEGGAGQPVAYWSAQQVIAKRLAQPFDGRNADAIQALDTLLRDAVALRMAADVPLGAFLSGGIDSSMVVALMQAQSSRPVQTFSIGFAEAGYNEAPQAKAVAQHLGTDHTEWYVSAADALAVVPKLPSIYDEPFADSSQIPTLLVAQLARQQVTVALSGDGGDELFGGYNRYVWGQTLWQRLQPWPPSLRRWGATALTALSPAQWDGVSRPLLALVPDHRRPRLMGDKLHKLAALLNCPTPDDLYRQLVSHWSPAELMPGIVEAPTALTDPARQLNLNDFTQRMMGLDLISYLPDDILCKVDRASMAVSLEARVPLLDHRLVEFAWRLPQSMKIHQGQGKWLLRQVLNRYVPAELFERPKMGFGVPIDVWLRGPLRDWAEELLNEQRLREQGYFNPAPIRRVWAEHLSGQRNWAYWLWDVLMFQAWLHNQRA